MTCLCYWWPTQSPATAKGKSSRYDADWYTYINIYIYIYALAGGILNSQEMRAFISYVAVYVSYYENNGFVVTPGRGRAEGAEQLNRRWEAVARRRGRGGGGSGEDHQAQGATALLGAETGRISPAALCGRPQPGGSLRERRGGGGGELNSQ